MAERVKRLSSEFLAWLERALADRGLSPNAAALRAGIDPAQVSKGIAGKLNLSDRVLGELAGLIDLAPADLIAKANADRWGAPAPAIPFDAAAFDHLRELTLEGFAIPYYGRVGCGEFLELCEVAQGVRNVPARFVDDPADPTLGTVEAWGDSMNRAKIHEGMTLLVKCQNTARPGQVVLADVPFHGTTCKRLVREDGRLFLAAESSSGYPRIEVNPDVRIVGVVCAAWLVAEFS
jgi:SOS-response transcriptional repressor LexA